MRHFFARLCVIVGTALYVIAALIALVYLPGVVLVLRAPPLAALLMTVLMAAPPLVVGTILRRAGRAAPRPWYRVKEGRMARLDAGDD